MKTAFLIVGPTGTGKSHLALKLAQERQLPIINADSVQVYKDLVIGSAQPSVEDLKHAEHYLYGYLPAGSVLTAADYSRQVESLLATTLQGRSLIFCGGSGFYIQALEKGMYAVPRLSIEQKAEVEKQILNWGWQVAYEKLCAKDPDIVTKVHSNDHYRIRRAWEIIWVTGHAPSALHANRQGSPLYDKNTVKVGFDAPKDILLQRIQQRAAIMLKQGWIDEVKKLIEAGYGDWGALKSVGYNEILLYLNNGIVREQLMERIVTAHMQLIKKTKNLVCQR